MAEITIDMDVPEGIEVYGHERHDEGHAFEVGWDWPERCRCDRCGRDEPANIQLRNTVYVVRDLDIWGQPSFWVYQPPQHYCGCGHRQHVTPPFKRKDVKYTYRFEREVVRLLIGSTEEEVARRLGISAETVCHIVANQLADEQSIAAERCITDIGLDEISLKKRHKLYVTILTDLSDAKRPQVLAVAKGKDGKAAKACLSKLSVEQRAQVRTHRTDMGSAYPSVCAEMLPCSTLVIDRFHVAKKLGDVVDGLRKKRPEATSARCLPRSAKHSAAACGSSVANRKGTGKLPQS